MKTHGEKPVRKGEVTITDVPVTPSFGQGITRSEGVISTDSKAVNGKQGETPPYGEVVKTDGEGISPYGETTKTDGEGTSPRGEAINVSFA
ncbi:MAG: hypothetical protein EPN85_06475 [Bacteroidetes bacterium]|nr:MAG: hypothetical protein EPN85_06475 [Bacteroidota bacterium]